MPGERLVALDDPTLDRIAIGTVVHEVPGAVGDLARGLGRRALPQPIDELDLEALDLIGRVPGASRGSGSAIVSFHIAVATSSRLRSVI